MNDTVVIICTLAGTIVSAIGAAFGASALTNHRLARLEKKVDEHNHFDSRITRCEESTKSAHHRISELGAAK